jgi:hypothetical protein
MTRILRYFSKPEFAPAMLRVGTFKALADGAISFGTIENLIKNPKAPAPSQDDALAPFQYGLAITA